MNTATSLLDQAQAELDARGVRDVKFFFDPAMSGMSLSDARDIFAGVLLSYFSGDRTAFTGVDQKVAS